MTHTGRLPHSKPHGCWFLMNMKPLVVNLKVIVMTREQAIRTAAKYGMQAEVIYLMDRKGCSPIEALSELDIL